MPKIIGANLESNREIRRNQLIDAALSLVLEKGASALTVTAVAKRAGLSRSSIYEYFSSSADLVADLIMEELENYSKSLSVAVINCNQTPEAQIESWINEALNYVVDGRHLLAKSLNAVAAKDFRESEIGIAHRNLLKTIIGPLQDFGVKDIKISLNYLQAIIDCATQRIESGNDSAPEIDNAIKFALAGLTALR